MNLVEHWKDFIVDFLRVRSDFHSVHEDEDGIAFKYSYCGMRYVAHAFLSGRSTSQGAIELELEYRLSCLMTLIDKSFKDLWPGKSKGQCLVSWNQLIAITEVDESEVWPLTTWNCLNEVNTLIAEKSHAR